MTYSVILGEGEFSKLLQGYDVPFLRFCQLTLEEAEYLSRMGFEQGFFVVMWEDTNEAEAKEDNDECICASAFSEDDDWEDESALSADDEEDNEDGEEQNEAS